MKTCERELLVRLGVRKGLVYGGKLMEAQRHVLDVSNIHPAVRPKIAANHRDIVDEVRAAIEANDIVVVGMLGNPSVRRAQRAAAKKAGRAHRFLTYGSYLSLWRRRNALKMWTGWPTFPMVFVKGVFVGGADDLEKLDASGELDRMLGGTRA